MGSKIKMNKKKEIRLFYRILTSIIMLASGFNLLFLLVIFLIDPDFNELPFIMISTVFSGVMFYITFNIAVKNKIPKIIRWAR